MSVASVGFVGGGRIARIMLEGWRRAGAMPQRVVVSDPRAEGLAALMARFPEIETTADNSSAAAARVVLLGLHPPAFADCVPALRAALGPDAIVVSLAPKWTIARLSDLLGGFDRIARAIPNAPSIVGAGFNPIAFGPALSEADRSTLLRLFEPLGEAPVVDESHLEAFAVTAAMGPTYLWFQLYELRDLARSFGLPDELAELAVDRMTRGALDTMKADLAPAEVMDLVAVHPMADEEPALQAAYRTRLTAVMDRIRPA